MSTRTERFADKRSLEENLKTLKELTKQNGNGVCADCGQRDPRWASFNIGVFICLDCAGNTMSHPLESIGH